jgi:hypothetical protein
MANTKHRLFLGVMITVIIITIIFLIYNGISYYNLSLDERSSHPGHEIYKPSGIFGHGYGIIGSLLLLIGVSSYMARKRYRFLSRTGLLKHWLEFHIFLCTLGPLLVLFHTAFKFGGLVAISFWSMVAVFLSGIIGRFIYLQIPRSIEGRELDLNEIIGMKTDLVNKLKTNYNLDDESFNFLTESVDPDTELYHSNPFKRYINKYRNYRKLIQTAENNLRKKNLPAAEYKMAINFIKESRRLTIRIRGLASMQKMFRYWHAVHLPFAIIMLIIALIHISVALLFGYRWII